MNCDLNDYINDQKKSNILNIIQILQNELNSESKQLKQMLNQLNTGETDPNRLKDEESDISFLDSKD